MGAALVYQHYQLLKDAYPDMQLRCNAGGSFCIEGKLHFLGDYHGQVIEDTYIIKVTIPEYYPRTLPSVQETGGRIPKDFHHYTNQSLCLGARFAVLKAFLMEPTLLGFINRCMLPYYILIVTKKSMVHCRLENFLTEHKGYLNTIEITLGLRLPKPHSGYCEYWQAGGLADMVNAHVRAISGSVTATVRNWRQ